MNIKGLQKVLGETEEIFTCSTNDQHNHIVNVKNKESKAEDATPLWKSSKIRYNLKYYFPLIHYMKYKSMKIKRSEKKNNNHIPHCVSK